MKKIILASILAFSSHLAFAEAQTPAVDPAFAEVDALIKANNLTGAYQALNKLAQAGNAQALYNLAYLTQTGQGTQKDEKKALQLYEQSAAKGYPVANYVLGKNYLTGALGLKQDPVKAKQYLEKASKANFNDATIDLAILYFSENSAASDKKGTQLLDPLIKQGNYQAIHARALYDISDGFKTKNEASIKKGLQSIQDLAKKGYVPALMAVGNMFTNGNIIPQNLPEAKKIFAALAERNVPQAKESLAAVEQLMASQATKPTKK